MSSYTSSFKGFIVTFLLALTLVLAFFAAASEWLIRTHVLPNDPSGEKLRLLDESPVANAAFGDSHMAYAFAGEAGVFLNHAQPGDGLDDIYLKIHRAFADKEPGKVIVTADVHLLSTQRITQPPKTYLSQSKGNKAWLQLAVADNWHRQFIVGYWKEFLTGGDFVPKETLLPTTGWLQNKGFWQKRDAVFKQNWLENRRRAQSIAKQDSTYTLGQQKYESILEFLSQKGADICMVVMPLAPDYRRAVESDMKYADATKFFQDLAQTYQAHYVDLSTVFDNRPDYFADGDHLNMLGAKSFTVLVRQACFGKGM